MYRNIRSINITGLKEPNYLEDKRGLLCRFCGGNVQSLTQKERKRGKGNHSLPQFIGNKNLFTLYECNCCGSFFGSSPGPEQQLSLQLILTRVIFGINEVGWHKPVELGGGQTITFDDNLQDINGNKEKGIIFEKCVDSMKLLLKLEVNQQGKVGLKYLCEHCKKPLVGAFPCCVCGNPINELVRQGFTIEVPEYNSIASFKAYVKMALSIMPEEYIDEFKDARDWIMETKGRQGEEKRSHTNFYGQRRGLWLKPSNFNGNAENKVNVSLWERIDKSANIPYILFQLFWGQEMYLIEIPMCENVNYDEDILAKLPHLCSESEKGYDVKDLIDYSKM